MADSSSPVVPLAPVFARSEKSGSSGPWTVVCDFDGTIAHADTTDSLLERFALPEWEQIEAQWKAGFIGSRECLQAQVRLLRMTRAQLREHLETLTIDAGFRAFVDGCRARRLPVRVVSDGLDFVIDNILQRYNLSSLPVTANRLVATGPDRWDLEFPNAHERCSAASGTCKCASAAQSLPGTRVLLIGDGRSDFCLARNADFVFSKGSLTAHCERAGIAHRPFEDFADVPYLLSELLDHPYHHLHRQPMSWRALAGVVTHE